MKIIFNFGTIICMICIISGSIFLILWIKNLYKKIQSKNWLVASGKIIASRIIETEFTFMEGGSTTGYSYEIKYEFEINNVLYSGNKINFLKIETTSKKTINKMLEKYKLGTNVNVYYNKNNFNDCILEPGIDVFSKIVIVFIILFILLFIIIIIKIN
jgi:hypothetical protein